MAVNFLQVEDYGIPVLIVEVDGCIIPKVPIDDESRVYLMLKDTTFFVT